MVITGEHEYETAWVFSYNTKAYVETGKIRHALVGNGPLIVPKDGSPPRFAATAHPLDDQVR